jgi:hypothetical protein
MQSADKSGISQHGRRLVAAALAAVAALAFAAGASGATLRAATLTAPEKAFVTQYKKLIPTLNKASDAVISAVNKSGSDTDAQIGTAFTAAAKQWASATAPLAKLKAPSAFAASFAKLTRETPAVEADLLAVARAGSASNATAGKKAGSKLVADFTALATDVDQFGKKIGLR